MKGLKIDADMTVTGTGTACVGMMEWETPFVVFDKKYRWHSDRVAWLEDSFHTLHEGETVHVKAFAYITGIDRFHLRRVKISA